MFDFLATPRILVKVLMFCLGILFSQSVFAIDDCFSLIETKQYYKALDLCKKNAKKGNVGAQFNLGTLYYQGLGVMSDKRIAYKWMLKAAKKNHPLAQYNISIMLANGIGAKTDLVKAYAWMTLAKKNNAEDAASAYQKMQEELSKSEKQQAEKLIKDLLTKELKN